MLSAHYDLLIRRGICVTPWGMEQADVGVRAGTIAAIGVASDATGETRINASGLHVLPGLIDPHVHFREPGDAGVETIATGTKGAVLGGLAAVFDMPNTSPAITDAERLAWKQEYVERVAWCDIGFYVGATKTNISDLAELELGRGVCGIKVFAGSSTGDLLVEDDEHLERVMRSGRRRIAYHSEDEYRLQARRALFKSGDPYACHMQWRDEETAFLGTRRLIALAQATGRPAHILHVSTAEELAYLPQFRDLATVEVLVNHLTQVAPDCYERLGGFAVMNPPLRDRRHYEAAWEAVRDGTVDTVGSDHAPHPRAAKQKPWPECAAGLTGVQTIVPVMLDHVNAGRLSLP
ncbi:MAG: dihydroorotase, partial [Alphaproteobacteria bacterium]|nr:dihydroorotase [Alphaproteobacteria bacterium]